MIKILVAYASKHQSTAEIACCIGELLQQEQDFRIDISYVEAVEAVESYDAVILGSAVYGGQWQPAASSFLKKYEHELSRRPVWLFSSGPLGEGDPQILLKGWTFPAALQPVAGRIHPRDIVLFHGSLDPTEFNRLERSAMKLAHTKFGDFRDWDMIRAWSEKIAQSLTEEFRKESS